MVETIYNGKVAIIEPISDEILSFLTKRLPNATTELTDDAEVVIIDEANTYKVSEDATTYAILQKLWDKNKIFLFINPKEGTYALEGKLQQNGVPIPPANDEDLVTFENIRLYATRADGTSFYHEIPGGESCGETGQTVLLTKQDSVVEVQIPPTNDVVVPSNYLKGRLAENFAAWLNDFAQQGEQRNIAFSRATSDEYPVECKTLTYHDFVKVSHDWIKNCNSKAKIPSAKTIDAKSQLVIYAAYSKKDKSDLYDVNVYQEFDAAKSYVPNTVVHKHGLYKDKYTVITKNTIEIQKNKCADLRRCPALLIWPNENDGGKPATGHFKRKNNGGFTSKHLMFWRETSVAYRSEKRRKRFR